MKWVGTKLVVGQGYKLIAFHLETQDAYHHQYPQKNITDDDLKVLKADKGNTIVIIDHGDTTKKKMEEVLQTCGAVQVDAFNFESHNRTVRYKINNSKLVISSYPKQKAILIPYPRPPMLYGKPKLHKVGIPMRPVVSYIPAPIYKLAKYIAIRVKSQIYSLSQYQTIKHVTPPQAELISFDVTALFPNIPLKATI